MDGRRGDRARVRRAGSRGTATTPGATLPSCHDKRTRMTMLRTPLLSISNILTAALAAVSLSALASAQDRYVDAQCGNNFADGLTPDSAWRSVDFALNGPQAPLPHGTTIHLLGTTGVAYSPS